MERISPGRWDTVRQPTQEELKMTGVLEFTIEDVSAKILLQGRQLLSVFPGGEHEADADAGFSPWTGIYPYRLVKGEPISSAEILKRIAQ